MKKYLTIFVGLVLIMPLAVVIILGMDYFGLRRNHFNFTALDIDSRIIDSVTIVMTDGQNDTVFSNGKMIKNTFRDLYGKESFNFKIKNNFINHSFQDYKFCSWHKTNYTVCLTANKDTVFVDWSMKTFWYRQEGRNGVKNWLTN